MPTALSIIEDAHKYIQVLGRGQSLSAAQAQDALTLLNDMISSWSVEGGLVYTETKETFNLTGAQSYTIGSGGNFNTTRPTEIKAAYVSSGGIDYPLTPFDEKQYANITDKGTTGIAEYFYYDNNYPLANIYFYPVTSSGYTATLYSVKQITEFTSLTDNISFPPGYPLALKTNLAILLCPMFEREPTTTLQKMASNSKTAIFTANARNNNNIATTDNALLLNDTFDIYRGY